MDETPVNSSEKQQKRKRHQQLIRNFKGEDADFIEFNRVRYTLFMQQLAAFTAFDPTLNAAFAASWLVNITDCEQHPTDEVLRDTLQHTTHQLQQKTNAALNLVADVEYYVKKAFNESPALWDEFAFAHRYRAIQSTTGTVLWLFTMLRVLQDYEADLLTAGMPPALIASLTTASGNLAQAEIEQEYHKRLRLRQTRLRVQKLNRLHGYLQRVQQAAAVIYKNDAVSRKQFEG